jgi:hypothetical protein
MARSQVKSSTFQKQQSLTWEREGLASWMGECIASCPHEGVP